MNRTIKFRAKKAIGEEWVYGHYFQIYPYKDFSGNLLKDKPTHYIITQEIDPCTDSVIPETIGQFTGLHDRKEKEIYEGDIIRVKYRDKPAYQTNIGVVTFEFGSFILNDSTLYSYKEYEVFEVIGNIHDNKDLLTKIKIKNE
jgi:uncharacterized phage protein (TIGR01671 family)